MGFQRLLRPHPACRRRLVICTQVSPIIIFMDLPQESGGIPAAAVPPGSMPVRACPLHASELYIISISICLFPGHLASWRCPFSLTVIFKRQLPRGGGDGTAAALPPSMLAKASHLHASKCRIILWKTCWSRTRCDAEQRLLRSKATPAAQVWVWRCTAGASHHQEHAQGCLPGEPLAALPPFA